MKNTILITVLVGAVAGAGSSVLTRGLTKAPAQEPSADHTAGLTPGGAVGDDVAEQMAALQRENSELAMRLAALEKRGASSSREAVANQGSEDYEQLQQDIADLAAALKDPQSVQAVGLRSSVRLAMEQIKEEDDLVRQQEREERDIARIDERLDELQGKLGLDQVQKKSMREVLLTETNKRNELFSAMRNGAGGMDRNTIRTSMTELREEVNTSLANILSPMQLEDYKALEAESGWGGFGGRGGGGGGRGGRGGGGGGGGNGGGGAGQ